MKERSLPNQYRMLEAIKSRFDATEVKTGMERARELAEQSREIERAEDENANKPESLTTAVEQSTLFEEAA